MAYHHHHIQYTQPSHQNRQMHHNQQFSNGSEVPDTGEYLNNGATGQEFLNSSLLRREQQLSPDDLHHNLQYSADPDTAVLGNTVAAELEKSPAYLLEHLATFTVNKESGIVFPADGMRRLLQLEKTTGIWSQKMQLCLNNQWILIMDFETGNIIERFPATLIQEPTAFTSTDAMELYNNILVFIVAGGGGAQSEMHIFQSQSVSAVHLVEDMKNLRQGKVPTQSSHLSLPRERGAAEHDREKDKHSASHNRQQLEQQQQRGERGRYQHVHPNHHNMHQQQPGIGADSDSEHDLGQMASSAVISGTSPDDNSSTSSDKYERDVTVLNHCFDDIEKFIARLQHAAAASRELDRRRRNRKSKTKRDPGEGLLYLRTRPPQEKEFIDIFAKFKLSFNLLAKLKAHIHDPNAPELVHFLFTPLALIVEASSDAYYDGQLPARVNAPLLTREATNLLINCVTSKETELWRSLGDAWIIPRDQWKDDVPTYHPVFFDGWSPDYLVIDELGNAQSPTGVSLLTSARAQMTGGANSTFGSMHATSKRLHRMSRGAVAVDQVAGLPGYDEYEVGIDETHDNHISQRQRERERDQQQHHHILDYNTTNSNISIESLMRNDLVPTGQQSIGTSGAAATNPLVSVDSLSAGLQQLNTRHRNNHHHGESTANNDGTAADGNVTHHALEGKNDHQILVDAWINQLQSVGAKIVLVTYQRTANNDKELSVMRGEYLEILDDTRKWWKARNIRGHIAHVPHTIVAPYNYQNGEGTLATSQQQPQPQQQGDDSQQSHEQPDPSRSSTDTINWIRSKHIGKKGEFRYF